MQVIVWIAIGIAAGWLAGMMMKGRDYGLIGNTILGLIGSLVGASLLNLLGASEPPALWQQAIVAALGAMVVLGLARRLRPLARQSRAVLGDVAAAGVDLETRIRKLSEFERKLVARMLERRPLHDPNAAFDEQMSFGQRIADRVAAFGGSWTFIGLFMAVMLLWITINVAHLTHFDPFPFILLNLVLSCLAALQAPVIMMSQNRLSAKDRHDAKCDYDVNVRAELEITRLHEKLDRRDAEIDELIEINRRQLKLLEQLTTGSAGA